MISPVLFDSIDKLQDELANSLGNQLGIQSFYDTFISLRIITPSIISNSFEEKIFLYSYFT